MMLLEWLVFVLALCPLQEARGIFVIQAVNKTSAHEDPELNMSVGGEKEPDHETIAETATTLEMANPPQKATTPEMANPPEKTTTLEMTTKTTGPDCVLPPGLAEEIHGYQATVNHIIDYVVRGPHRGRAYDTLALLVDTFGPRQSGSRVLEEAIDWMIEKSRAEGLENVHTEDVMVPRWVRNDESAWMIQPRLSQLSILGLGSSVGTPPEGITAEVLVVKDFDDLERHAGQAKGKIVVFNPEWVSYGTTAQYRTRGATQAAKVGAVASLIRTVGPFSINSPHTGQQHYKDNVPTIPTACITIEDAAMLERFQRRGVRVVVQLNMGAQTYPDVVSRNTIAEVKGSEKPDEVVVISGHLDSWDVGQGAMDDGGGAMISWEASVVLQRMGLRPRRTVRTILWTGEEQGLLGGAKYYENHKNGSERFQILMESDSGTFTPLGLQFSGTKEATCVMREVMKLLHPLNATKVRYPAQVPDLGIWKQKGVPLGSLYNDNAKYFWFHHSAGDTMTVEDPDTLDHCLALWTAVAYVTANMTYKLPHGPPQKLN